MDKRRIVFDISTVTNDLLKQVAKFNDANFNIRPAEERWSAGQISEHLLVLAKNVNRNLRARSVAAGRPADEKIDVISAVFDDYDRKYSSPEPIIPSNEPKNLAEMLDGLEVEHKRLIEVVDTLELTELCKGFNHPSLGAFTRFEWIYFIIHHAYRHINQMEKIFVELSFEIA